MRLARPLYGLTKGIYDILATYLLAWVLLFALLALGFQLLLSLFTGMYGFSSTESFWSWVDGADLPGGLRALHLRLGGALLLHCAVFVTLRRQILAVKGHTERSVDRGLRWYRALADRSPNFEAVCGFIFSLAVTLLLIPFVIQPTLVPLDWGGAAWTRRAANLLDGSATAATVESVIGLYRKLYARPVVAEGVSPQELEPPAPPSAPVRPGMPPRPVKPPRKHRLMDRWDSYIWRVVEDRHQFAVLKALIYVESGGLQYAVSSTGCAGLTQFCSRTARSGGFRRIFGTGQVYPCRCRGVCRVSRAAKRDLESGDPARIRSRRDEFPCELTDARFDPAKAVRAGQAFVRRLSRRYGGNLYLIYIGYNSGPAVSGRLWRALGRDPKADLPAIEARLIDALKPYFRRSAGSRARNLVRVHLPKIQRAYLRYLAQARAAGK